MQLAMEYFETDQITPEMYDEGKQITFSILYGSGHISEGIPPLLQKIKAFENELWGQYEAHNQIWGPWSIRRFTVPDPSPSKVLNYYVQCLEFETTIQKLHNLRQRLSGFKSKVVLYTYDSILVDVLREEAGAIKNICPEVLENGDYPVKLSMGSDYHNLSPVA